MGSLLRLLLVAPLGLLLLGERALAGDADPPEAGSSLSKDWLAGDAASGDWLGMRSRLAECGFVPYAVWTGEVVRSFSGGLKRDTDWAGLLEFGADIDLEPLAGWDGAGVRVSALWIQHDEDPSAEFLGNFDEISNIAGEATVRFYQAYLRQDLHEGAFSFKLGQLVLDEDFMVSEGASLFLNASFGAMTVESANIPAPIYPIAVLGGWAQWRFAKEIALQVGVYNGDTGTQNSNENGFDYDFGSPEGVALLAELGIDTALLGRDATLKLGGYYHSGAFIDLDSGKREWGNYALYLVLDQVLVGTRDASRLAAFFRAGVSPLDDRNQVDWVLDAGFTARGFREVDRVGLGFSRSHFGSKFVSTQKLAGTPVTDAESILEITYSAPVTPWFALQPNLQYVIDPENARVSDVFVGGIRATISF